MFAAALIMLCSIGMAADSIVRQRYAFFMCAAKNIKLILNSGKI
jgi:hypothetical protein